MRLPDTASRLKLILCAVTLSVLLPHGAGMGPGDAEAQSGGLPGFGGATQQPRMLIIFDTSRSMRWTPDESAEYPNMDYDPPGVGATTRVCGTANQGRNIDITCPAGQTISSIEFAYYGRQAESDLRCDLGTTMPTDNTSGCDLSGSVMESGVYRGWKNIKARVETLCLGQASCTWNMDNGFDGNPCYMTSKFGVASVICGNDPCPPGNTSSKFCLGKRAVYNVVDTAEPLIEFAVAGYFQQYWEKANPEIPAGYVTECRYDRISAGGPTALWWNNGAPAPARANDWRDLTNHAGSLPAAGAPGVDFSCNPEAMTSASNLAGGTAPVALNTTCAMGQPARTCNMRWSWQNSFNTSGGAWWSGARYQHPNAACRTTIPTNPAATTGLCAPTIPDPDTQFANATGVLSTIYVPATGVPGGTCAGAASEFTDRFGAANVYGTAVHGSCTAGNMCTYFRHPTGDGLNNINPVNVYRDYGTAWPVTINGTQYQQRSGPSGEGPQTLAASLFGGTCPATVNGFTNGAWAGCSGTNPCDLTRSGASATPTDNFSCPSGTWGAPAGGVCTHNRTNRRADNLSGSLDGIAYTLLPLANWDAYSYMLDGNVACTDTGNFTITSGNYNGTAVPCAAGTSVTAAHNCQARFINKTWRSDLGKTVCNFEIKRLTYRATTPATNNQTCSYTRQRYTYRQQIQVCAYRAYIYQFQRRRFEYNFQLVAGDYEGSFLTGNLQYPPTAPVGSEYCLSTNAPQVQATYADGTGFTVPGGANCQAELAPGTGGCPTTAQRCKLRWGSAMNQRFANYLGGGTGGAKDRLQPFSSSGPTPGCPVGDPNANTGALPNLPAGYNSIWSDWCYTQPGGQPYVARTWQPKKLVADYYSLAASGLAQNNAGSRSAWLPYYFDGTSFNPFEHPDKAYDRFSWLTEPDVAEVQTQVSGAGPCAPSTTCPFDTKKVGLSLLPPTIAPAWQYGVTAYRWGDNMSDPKRLLRRYDAATNPMGLRMPEIGDMTPLSGALQNAHDYINWVRTNTSAVGGDDLASCRKYSVLLVTDGLEEPDPVATGTDPVGVVTGMRNDGIDVYVVGFGVAGGLLDSMAVAAGTDVGGSAYDATNYTALMTALNDIVGQQLNGYYTRSKPTITTDGKRVYAAYFAHSGTSPREYFGYLDAYPIANGLVSSSPVWKFDDQLNNMPAASRELWARANGLDYATKVDELNNCSGDNDEITETITGNGWCDNWERAAANPAVYWVRNDRSGIKVGTFTDGQVKKSRLTSIVHAQPAAIGAPFFSDTWASPNLGMSEEGSSFENTKFFASYKAFKTQTNYSYASGNTVNMQAREARVYVQSNGGLLHAIREDPNETVLTSATWMGTEKWGFAPRRMMERWLSLREGGKYGLDGAMALSDVCFTESDCEDTSGSKWRTVLVGAAGRGGNYLYALDISDPDKPVWLWDFNNSSGNNPQDKNMGETESGPVLARVRLGGDSYKWGVFVGGGYSSTGETSCSADWDDSDPSDRPIGNFFYVLDADPAERNGYHAEPMCSEGCSSRQHWAKWCIDPVNRLRDAANNPVGPPKNNGPGRARLVRPNDGSRVKTVYFGDTDGKLLRMNMLDDRARDWEPAIWFNPFTTGCNVPVNPTVDHPGAPPAKSLPLSEPPQAEGLPELWTRPIVGLHDLPPDSTGRNVVYVGSGNSRVPEDVNVQNYFWAVEDNTGVTGETCNGAALWAVYLDKAAGEKVLSEPAIVGPYIIVPVYVPPSGAGGCGAAGFTKFYCFHKISGSPEYCFNETPAAQLLDPAPQMISGGRMTRVTYASPGIASDLVSLNNSIVYLPGAGAGGSAAGIVPNQLPIGGVGQPFRVKSWRRVR